MNEVQHAIESWIRDIIEETVRKAVPAALEDYFKNAVDPLKHYYTKDQVCQKMNICKATYHNWINSGKLTETKIKGRVYVDSRALEKLLSESTVKKNG